MGCGEPGDLEKYIQEVADNLGGESGDRLYAQLAADLVRFFPILRIFDSLSLDMDRVTRGLLLTRPEQDVSVNGYCCVVAWHFAKDHDEETNPPSFRDYAVDSSSAQKTKDRVSGR